MTDKESIQEAEKMLIESEREYEAACAEEQAARNRQASALNKLNAARIWHMLQKAHNGIKY